MNMRNMCLAAACGVAIGLSSAAAHADDFTWQGRLLDGGGPASGVYDFEFELYDMAVGGALINGLTLAVDDVNVVDGLVTVDLDFGAGVFLGDDRWLQVNVKADADGVYSALDPRQPLHPTPYSQYAFRAANIGDGGLPGIYSDPINFNNPGNQFSGNGSGLTKLNADELLTGNVDAARMPTGGSWSLDSGLNLDGGAFFFDPINNRLGLNTTVPGTTLGVVGTGRFSGDMFFGNDGSGNIQFDVSNAQIDTFNGGVNKARLWGATWGELLLWDTEGQQTVELSSSLNLFGAGGLILSNEDASVETVLLNGGWNSGGQLILRSSENTDTIVINGEGISGGTFGMFNDAGSQTLLIDSDSGGGSLMTMSNAAGATTINVDGDSGGGSFLSLNNATGSNRITIDGESNGGGRIQVDQADNSTGVVVDGDAGTNVGGLITVHDENSTATVEINGSETGTDGGQIALSDASGNQTILIDGDIGGQARISMFNPANPSASLWIDMDSNDNGRFRLFEATPAGSDEMVLIHTESTGTNAGGQIVLRNDTGVGTIELDANWAGTGDGRIRTSEMEITGGADLSEQFSITSPDGVSVEPGMVVCIDPLNPGKLIVSTQEYDFTVAGIISGAGGVKPGMLMAHQGTVADGDTPVALTGRVYVWCDASNGAIRPGHLLTTSSMPGHAMRATDRDLSHGAVIGKAMTSLDEGTGLVLVLVSLH